VIVEVSASWRRRWHLRTLMWGWAQVALCVLAVWAMVQLLWPTGVWRVVLFLALVPVEVLIALSAGAARTKHSGAFISSHDVMMLKKQLRARADIRVSEDAHMFGGACAQRWGRDSIIVSVGDFNDRELLAVIAHELGHTKQSVLSKVLAPSVARLGLVMLWLWGLHGDWLKLGVGVVAGALLWIWLLYSHSVRLRGVSLVVGWACWWWWLAGKTVAPVLAAIALWLVWRAVGALWSRISELLADEAVVAVEDGHVALSSALSRVAGYSVVWWKRPFASHPEPHKRGTGRRAARAG
jgi:hypothetical protein